jgi:enolase
MVLPIGAKTFRDGLQMIVSVYHALQDVLKDKGYATTVGDEGGFAPAVSSNEEPFVLLEEALSRVGLAPGKDISFGIDAAASEFYHDGQYELKKEGKWMGSADVGEWLTALCGKYPIVSMEDIFAEDDWDAWSAFTKNNASNVQLVGDDLYVTNVKRLEKGIATHASTAILIKLNQIGTLSETIDAILLARKNNMASIVSHRSGETEDPFIADLVVAMGTGQIKSGAPCRSERTAKYNRLLAIEEELGKLGHYTIPAFISPHT